MVVYMDSSIFHTLPMLDGYDWDMFDMRSQFRHLGPLIFKTFEEKKLTFAEKEAHITIKVIFLAFKMVGSGNFIVFLDPI